MPGRRVVWRFFQISCCNVLQFSAGGCYNRVVAGHFVVFADAGEDLGDGGAVEVGAGVAIFSFGADHDGVRPVDYLGEDFALALDGHELGAGGFGYFGFHFGAGGFEDGLDFFADAGLVEHAVGGGLEGAEVGGLGAGGELVGDDGVTVFEVRGDEGVLFYVHGLVVLNLPRWCGRGGDQYFIITKIRICVDNCKIY